MAILDQRPSGSSGLKQQRLLFHVAHTRMNKSNVYVSDDCVGSVLGLGLAERVSERATE